MAWVEFGRRLAWQMRRFTGGVTTASTFELDRHLIPFQTQHTK